MNFSIGFWMSVNARPVGAEGAASWEGFATYFAEKGHEKEGS